MAASHRALTSITPGTAAERAALLKHTKYAAIKATHDFVPVAIETLGPINEEGTSFLCEIGERMKGVSGDPRETAYLFQSVRDNTESRPWDESPKRVVSIIIVEGWAIFVNLTSYMYADGWKKNIPP